MGSCGVLLCSFPFGLSVFACGSAEGVVLSCMAGFGHLS